MMILAKGRPSGWTKFQTLTLWCRLRESWVSKLTTQIIIYKGNQFSKRVKTCFNLPRILTAAFWLVIRWHSSVTARLRVEANLTLLHLKVTLRMGFPTMEHPIWLRLVWASRRVNSMRCKIRFVKDWVLWGVVSLQCAILKHTIKTDSLRVSALSRKCSSQICSWGRIFCKFRKSTSQLWAKTFNLSSKMKIWETNCSCWKRTREPVLTI